MAVCEERSFDVRDVAASNALGRAGAAHDLQAGVAVALEDLQIVIVPRDIEGGWRLGEGRLNRREDLAIALFVGVLKRAEDQVDRPGQEVGQGTPAESAVRAPGLERVVSANDQPLGRVLLQQRCKFSRQRLGCLHVRALGQTLLGEVPGIDVEDDRADSAGHTGDGRKNRPKRGAGASVARNELDLVRVEVGLLTEEAIVAEMAPVVIAGNEDPSRARRCDLFAQDLFAFLDRIFFDPGRVDVVAEKENRRVLGIDVGPSSEGVEHGLALHGHASIADKHNSMDQIRLAGKVGVRRNDRSAFRNERGAFGGVVRPFDSLLERKAAGGRRAEEEGC